MTYKVSSGTISIYSLLITHFVFCEGDCGISEVSIATVSADVGHKARTISKSVVDKLLAIVSCYTRTSAITDKSQADVPCCAVKSCPLVNDCDLLAGFSEFNLPSPI